MDLLKKSLELHKLYHGEPTGKSIDPSMLKLRAKLVREEAFETIDAIDELCLASSPEEARRLVAHLLCELADQMVIGGGTVIHLGYQKIFSQVYQIVHDTNMSKAYDTMEEAMKMLKAMDADIPGLMINAVDVGSTEKYVIVNKDGKIMKRPGTVKPWVKVEKLLKQLDDEKNQIG